MIRLLVIIVLACFLCAALTLVGCTSHKGETVALKPWPPDTLWFIKKAGMTYKAYTRWPPDTSSDVYELSLMRQPPPGLLVDTIPNTRTPRIANVRPQALGEDPTQPPGPWPPDTMRLSRLILLHNTPIH
jgi:hypothetical protein